MLDQWTSAIRPEIGAERVAVVATIPCQGEQVARIPAGDLRPNPRIRFLGGRAVDVGDVQRLDIHEGSHFQRPDAVMGAIGVVPRWVITVEAG